MSTLGESQHVAALLARIRERGDSEALWWRGRSVSCAELDRKIDQWTDRLGLRGFAAGQMLGLLGDYSPETTALMLALMKLGGIIVPFTRAVTREIPEMARVAGLGELVRFDEHDGHTFERLEASAPAALVDQFRQRRNPGLIVFTSGSTGKPKGILHDVERVTKKFATPRTAHRTLLFLLMDHFGGFNTLLSALSYGGVLVAPSDRKPEDVARAIVGGRVELLPVTPTFLNLLLASGCASEHDLSSVKLITYGTEVMPESTLRRLAEVFPNARLQQTYGLSELGVLRSKSQDSSSVWVKVGGEGFDIKIVDGILHVKSESAMVGYLNAPSPFDAEGWFNTGDAVEQKGEFLRILGRKSDMINVGGQKVFPVEVETALLDAENVLDVAVFGERNPIMGQLVVARVSLREPEELLALKARLRKHCLERLAPYKVPVKFVIAEGEQHNQRYKKARPTAEPGAGS
jgi:long-chain acyl-CoA synthetase